MNSRGGDVYIRPHGESEHGVVFLDDLPFDKALQVSEKYACCVVSTSENNTQVWLATDRKLSKGERKRVQSWMTSVGYTDPGSVSGDHLGRLCGLRSQKRNCWVNLVVTTFGERYSPKIEPHLSSPLGEACVSPSPLQSIKMPQNSQSGFNKWSENFESILQSIKMPQNSQSPSEREFGWAVGALKHGVSFNNVINRLSAVAKERGKRQPDDYAKRTAMGAYRVLHPGS